MVGSLAGLVRIVAVTSIVLGLAVTSPGPVLAASTLTVTTTADSLPPCAPSSLSLRCAIAQANADGSGDTIAFNIPSTSPGCSGTPVVCAIRPVAALPTVTASSTTINGFSQPGSKPNANPLRAGINAVIVIRLDGNRAGAGVDGLTLAGSWTIVRGLSITGFRTASSPSGQISGGSGIALVGSNHVVQGNFLGLAPNGTTVGPNLYAGVNVFSSVGKETIGGSMPPAANVISGNGSCSFGDCLGFGVYVNTGSGTVIAGNAIGTTASGTAARET